MPEKDKKGKRREHIPLAEGWARRNYGTGRSAPGWLGSSCAHKKHVAGEASSEAALSHAAISNFQKATEIQYRTRILIHCKIRYGKGCTRKKLRMKLKKEK